MRQISYKILGVRIDSLTINQALAQIDGYIRKADRIYVTKPYVEFLVGANSDQRIKSILNKSALNLADGVSIQWAASYLYGTKKPNLFLSLIKILFDKAWLCEVIPQRIGGINLTVPLIRLAQKNRYKIAIIGGPKDIAQTQRNIQKLFPGLNLVGVWSGYFDSKQAQKIALDIGSKKPNIVFAGMGFSRQEKFISTYLRELNCNVAIGEGGSFDFTELGGKLKRAPAWMQRLNLEWLWRLILQPKRIKRQLAIPKFIYLVYRQRQKQK